MLENEHQATSSHTKIPAHGETRTRDPLLDRHQLHVKHQRGPGRDDVTGSSVAVGQSRRDDQLATRPGAHVKQTLVPAGDDLAASQTELEGRAAVPARVELGAVRQSACRGERGTSSEGVTIQSESAWGGESGGCRRSKRRHSSGSGITISGGSVFVNPATQKVRPKKVSM